MMGPCKSDRSLHEFNRLLLHALVQVWRDGVVADVYCGEADEETGRAPWTQLTMKFQCQQRGVIEYLEGACEWSERRLYLCRQ